MMHGSPSAADTGPLSVVATKEFFVALTVVVATL
jgi:hypothetical protein